MTVWLSVVLSRTVVAVADPDLQIGGGGGGGGVGEAEIQTLIKGEGGRPPGPLPWIHHCADIVTGVLTTLAVVIFRVKVSCIMSVDGIKLWLLTSLASLSLLNF